MNAESFRKRTQTLGFQIVSLARAIPKSEVARNLNGQLVRAGTSVGANYRAACRAKSRADFISKMRIVEEETDELLYWLEVLIGTGLVDRSTAAPLMKEGNEILAMTVQSIKTARSKI